MKFTFYLFVMTLVIDVQLFAQSSADAKINAILHSSSTDPDAGLQLIKDKNYAGANLFFSDEISKNEADRDSYFKRGVANWASSDTLNACRDWSAVLALGDTEMFNLLDSKCHGAMIVDNDTIPSKEYHSLWSVKKKDKAATPESKTVVEQMPEYPGGSNALFEYIQKNKKAEPNSQHGTVYVNFLISPEGKTKFPYVQRSLDKKIDREAMRLVKNMPEWTPGRNKGKAVYVRSSIPIRF